MTEQTNPAVPTFDPWKDFDTDAMHWVDAFCALYPAAPEPDTMIGWFANAIEVGRAAGKREDPS